MTNSYLAYNNFTKTFFRVKKLTREDYLNIKEKLLESFVEDKSCEFSVESYIIIILNEVVTDFSALLENKKGDILEDESILASIFDSVTDLYPELGVDNFCESFNQFVNEDSEKELSAEFEFTKEEDGTNISLAALRDIKSIENIRKMLETDIIGQEEAIGIIIDSLKLVTTGFSKHLSLFFIGTTGVGKTELCKVLAKSLYGSESNLVKINCGEYANNHEYAKLIGSPPGYVGHAEKSILRTKAEESNSWVICFDEIEKANTSLFNILLNLLDEGKITDSTGYVCDFSNSLFIFTSNTGISDNVGSSDIGFSGLKDKKFEEVKEEIKEELKKTFSSEFRNRIDSWVYFNTLTEEDALEIASIMLKKHGLKVEKRLLEYIVENAYSVLYGARNIHRFILSNILIKVADSVLKVGLDNREDYNFKISLKKGEINILPTEKNDKKKQQSEFI